MFRDALDKGKALVDKITSAVMNYTELENKVREATSDEPWGPHGGLMKEISQETRHYQGLCEVMNMLWERIFPENARNWRRIYKGLTLLAFLLRNGSEDVLKNAQEHIYDIRTLENYQCIDERGRDQGASVRAKTAEVIELIQDPEFLQAEREKAVADSKHYGGFCNTSPNYTFQRSSNYDEFESNPHMVSEEVFTFPEPADDALQHPSTSPRSPPAFDRHPRPGSQDQHQASPGHSLPMGKSEALVVPKKSEEPPPVLIDLSQGDSSTLHHSLQTTAKLPRPPSVELLATTPSSTQTMTTDLFADFNGFAAETPAPAKTYPNMGSAIFSSPPPLAATKSAVSSVVDADFGEFTSAKFDATASTAQSFTSTSSAASQPFVNFDFSPQPQNTISLHSDGPLTPSAVTPLATPTSIPKIAPTTSGASKAEKPSLGKLWQDFDSMSIDLDLRHKSAPAKPSAPSLRQLQNQKMTNNLQTSSTAKLPQAPIVAEMSGKSSKLPVGDNLNDLSFFE